MSESSPSKLINNPKSINSQDYIPASPIAQILGFVKLDDSPVSTSCNRTCQPTLLTSQKTKLIKKGLCTYNPPSSCKPIEISSTDTFETENQTGISNNSILHQQEILKAHLPKSKSYVLPTLSIPEKKIGFTFNYQPTKPDLIESPRIDNDIHTSSPHNSNTIPPISNNDYFNENLSTANKNQNNCNIQSPIAAILQNSPSPNDFYNCYNSNLPFDQNFDSNDSNSASTSPLNDFLRDQQNQDLISTRKFRLTDLPLPHDIKDRIIFLNKEYIKTKSQLHSEIEKLKSNYSAEQQRCKVELTSLIKKHKAEMKEKFDQNIASKPAVLEVKTVNGSICIATPKIPEKSPFSLTAPVKLAGPSSMKINLGPSKIPRPKSRIPVLSLRTSKSQKNICPPAPSKSTNSSSTATENNTSNSSSSNYSSASSCSSTEHYTGYTIQCCESPKMREERKILVDKQKKEIFDLNQKCSERLAKVKADHENKIFPLQDKIMVISSELKSMGHPIDDHDILQQIDEVQIKRKKMEPNRQLHLKSS